MLATYEAANALRDMAELIAIPAHGSTALAHGFAGMKGAKTQFANPQLALRLDIITPLARWRKPTNTKKHIQTTNYASDPLVHCQIVPSG